MISLKQFINETKGTKVDVPFGKKHPTNLIGQCVSLIQTYISVCLNQPAKPRGNAVDWDETYVKEGLGTITTKPRYGDLIVFNPPYAGKYGHIAIYIDANTMYDQNNGSHDNRKAGYAKMMRGGVYIRPNATLIPDDDFIYLVGTYRCNYDMRLRTKPSTSSPTLKVKDCTELQKKALTSQKPNDNAVFKKGTNLTAIEIVKNTKGEYWLRTYRNAYICIDDGSTKYCTKVN